ncbi:MAG: helix-turn-helix domain-containing protein [Alphaproteobacteria bacterium]|nr:helix-turn-helix domain-containing protein [Alphaproteobacteria bacterium]
MRAFPIRDDSDLARAIDLVDQLWDAPSGSPEADLRDVMAELIEHFEARELSQALPPPDPCKVIEARRAELGLSQRKLGELLGWKSSGRVSEVLSGKRQLTLEMVRDLERVLGIAPGLLVADRSPAPDGDVWVRLPGDLVSVARRAKFAGCGGLDDMVHAAVLIRLRALAVTSAASSATPTSSPASGSVRTFSEARSAA